jgi:hypothetical protein
MAHFAEIDEANLVKRILVVDNEHESHGEQYLNGLGLSGRWIQTSYNGSFRGKFAAINDIYDEQLDIFYTPELIEAVEVVTEEDADIFIENDDSVIEDIES